MSEVTRLPDAAAGGDPKAAAELLPLVYDELRRLAAARLAAARRCQTFQAAALVHKAYLRLVGTDAASRWDGRWHFFAAAEAKRRTLVEHGRGRILRCATRRWVVDPPVNRQAGESGCGWRGWRPEKFRPAGHTRHYRAVDHGRRGAAQAILPDTGYSGSSLSRIEHWRPAALGRGGRLLTVIFSHSGWRIGLLRFVRATPAHPGGEG